MYKIQRFRHLSEWVIKVKWWYNYFFTLFSQWVDNIREALLYLQDLPGLPDLQVVTILTVGIVVTEVIEVPLVTLLTGMTLVT